jgi:starch synthase
MEILHVSAELGPIAKVGGLGDVLHGLCKALLDKKQAVRVILPKYDTLDLNGIKNLEVFESQQTVYFDGRECTNTLWRGTVDEIPVVFIESQTPEAFFERGKIYGCPDDVDRFNYFCLSVLEYIRHGKFDIIHLHDWHTAILAGLIKDRFPKRETKVILTIHNLAYQGACGLTELKRLGWHHEHMRIADHYNLLKGGILFADKVTTVSTSYAHEILTTHLGGHLQKTLKAHQEKFSGILNGIDYSFWNPQTDKLFPFHYSADKLGEKQKLKSLLRKRLALAEENSPIACVITRLVPQKGPELIKGAILRILEWGGQFILLGSASDATTHNQFYNLKRKLAGSPHVHLELVFSEELSHLVFAASDLFLMPSLFEPCGLTQLIAMHYGTIPVVRATGGLLDTVCEGKNGFMFDHPTIESFHGALDRALKTWYQNPDKWHQLIQTCMHTDFSWKKPAEQYLALYSS